MLKLTLPAGNLHGLSTSVTFLAAGAGNNSCVSFKLIEVFTFLSFSGDGETACHGAERVPDVQRGLSSSPGSATVVVVVDSQLCQQRAQSCRIGDVDDRKPHRHLGDESGEEHFRFEIT